MSYIILYVKSMNISRTHFMVVVFVITIEMLDRPNCPQVFEMLWVRRVSQRGPTNTTTLHTTLSWKSRLYFLLGDSLSSSFTAPQKMREVDDVVASLCSKLAELLCLLPVGTLFDRELVLSPFIINMAKNTRYYS